MIVKRIVFHLSLFKSVFSGGKGHRWSSDSDEDPRKKRKGKQFSGEKTVSLQLFRKFK